MASRRSEVDAKKMRGGINVPRFLVFAGNQFYPLGGWQDFKGAFEDVIDALTKIANGGWDWWQIVDQITAPRKPRPSGRGKRRRLESGKSI